MLLRPPTATNLPYKSRIPPTPRPAPLRSMPQRTEILSTLYHLWLSVVVLCSLPSASSFAIYTAQPLSAGKNFGARDEVISSLGLSGFLRPR
eukprot:1009280-Rhodomonas_salina.2